MERITLTQRFQEFEQLTPENAVYKLIGPVLVKQDQVEAKSNVETRLGFIRSEMSDFFTKKIRFIKINLME